MNDKTDPEGPWTCDGCHAPFPASEWPTCIVGYTMQDPLGAFCDRCMVKIRPLIQARRCDVLTN